MNLRYKISLKKFIIVFIITIILLLSFALYISIIPKNFFKTNYSTLFLDKDGKILRAFLNSNDQWCFKSELKKVPQKLKSCIVLFEDKRFFSHFGVDIISVLRAIYQNISSFKRISGASTITMQVIRIFSKNKRTYFNKVKEMLQAIRLEFKFSKEKILEIYLNNAPFGSNIIGYTAASWRYFGTKPQKLTWAQAAYLAVIPNSPSLVNSSSGRKLLTNKRNRLLKRLFEKNIISKLDYDNSLLEKVPSKQIPFNILAPHFTREIKKRFLGKTISTTVDSKIQRIVKNYVKSYSKILNNMGINNIAVLIAETKSRKIRAYIGSQDFYDVKSLGKVNGVIAKRSSGSILKPFLYALAIDKGILVPESLIKDIPSYFGSYSPENYNHKYSGLVTAENALIRSLNVPAVRTLFKVGIYNFYNLLKSAGITTLFRSPNDYGLTLVLGGAEVKLYDLVTIYSGLGNLGNFRPLSFLKNDKKIYKSNHLLSYGATYLILNSLAKVARPGVDFYWNKYDHSFPISWKTGTSYGHKDAWAVGVNPKWTVGVWVGNFDSTENKEIIGSKSAGPLLFDIFQILPNSNSNGFEKKELYLKKVKLCKQTGYIFGENCNEFIEREIPEKCNLPKCPYHKKKYYNKKITCEVCSLCWNLKDRISKNVLVFPPEVVQYLKDSGNYTYTSIPHNKLCPGIHNEDSLEFIYPKNNLHISIPRDLNGTYQKIVVKIATKDKDSLYYFYLNNKLIIQTNKDFSYSFEKGWNTLTSIDIDGNKKQIRFYISKK